MFKTDPMLTTLTYEEAITRADLAGSFIAHPYWDIVSRMLSRTIQAETEELLSGDGHREVNRASVAMCRKVLQMPYFDIEQGRLAEGEYQKARAQTAKRRNPQIGRNVPNEAM